jgi:hypothetical protein
MTRDTHVATVDLDESADPRALGGAITTALCGHWDHEPRVAGRTTRTFPPPEPVAW